MRLLRPLLYRGAAISEEASDEHRVSNEFADTEVVALNSRSIPVILADAGTRQGMPERSDRPLMNVKGCQRMNRLGSVIFE